MHQALIQTHELLVVLLGSVALAQGFPSRAPHLVRDLRVGSEKLDDARELIHISRPIEKPGFAFVHQLSPRSHVRSNHSAPFRIGFQNRLSQSLIRVRRQNGEAGLGNEVVPFRTCNMTHEIYVGQSQRRRQLPQLCALRPIARNDQLHVRNLLH